MNECRPDPTRPPEAGAQVRLESWKEIAAYLRRDVTTVQRWEKQEGLPIHRHAHHKSNTVYAYRPELDAWRSRRSDNHHAKRSGALRNRWLWVTGTVATLVVLLFAVSVGEVWERLSVDQAPSHIDSIAVLPLEDLSGDPDEEYFSDGMTDEIIARLAQIRGLKVVSRTSVMRYKQSQKSLREIAGELDVDAIILGTVRRHGGDVRITVRMIEPVTDRHLWTDCYERDLRDVLSLQSDVAVAIARAINLELTTDEQAVLASVRRIHPGAHEAYLRGRYHWNKRTPASLRLSIDYYHRAIEREPDYALSYVGMADAYAALAGYGLLAPAEGWLASKRYARKALELDSTIAEGHAALAHVCCAYEWDWVSAEETFRKALAMKPGNAMARCWFSYMLASLGRMDESISEVLKAQDTEPLSLIVNRAVGRRYYLARRYDEAITQLQKTLELDPHYVPALLTLGEAYLGKNMFQEAVHIFKRALNVSGEMSWGEVPLLGIAYAKLGRMEDVTRILRDIEGLGTQRYVPPDMVAAIYAALNDRDRAFAWLEKAYVCRSEGITTLKMEPIWDPLRSDPRFDDLLQRMNLPD